MGRVHYFDHHLERTGRLFLSYVTIVPVGQIRHRDKLQKALQLTEVAKHLRAVEIRPIEAIDRVHGTLKRVPHERHVEQRPHQHAGVAQRHEEAGKQRRRHHYQDAHKHGILHGEQAAQQQPEHLGNPTKHQTDQRERTDPEPLERLRGEVVHDEEEHRRRKDLWHEAGRLAGIWLAGEPEKPTQR
uniref:Uncharacterized protein n=1 Tax=Anopheles melas TaxID=34690 RepID=A0A182TFW0_9DIPT